MHGKMQLKGNKDRNYKGRRLVGEVVMEKLFHRLNLQWNTVVEFPDPSRHQLTGAAQRFRYVTSARCALRPLRVKRDRSLHRGWGGGTQEEENVFMYKYYFWELFNGDFSPEARRAEQNSVTRSEDFPLHRLPPAAFHHDTHRERLSARERHRLQLVIHRWLARKISWKTRSSLANHHHRATNNTELSMQRGTLPSSICTETGPIMKLRILPKKWPEMIMSHSIPILLQKSLGIFTSS